MDTLLRLVSIRAPTIVGDRSQSLVKNSIVASSVLPFIWKINLNKSTFPFPNCRTLTIVYIYFLSSQTLASSRRLNCGEQRQAARRARVGANAWNRLRRRKIWKPHWWAVVSDRLQLEIQLTNHVYTSFAYDGHCLLSHISRPEI